MSRGTYLCFGAIPLNFPVGPGIPRFRGVERSLGLEATRRFVVSMDTYGRSIVSMDFDGRPTVSMDTHGRFSVSMDGSMVRNKMSDQVRSDAFLLRSLVVLK